MSAGDLRGCSAQARALERQDTERGPRRAAEESTVLISTRKQGNDLRQEKIPPAGVKGHEAWPSHRMATVSLPTSQTGKLLMQRALSALL